MDALIRYSKKIILRILLFPLRLFPVRKNQVMLVNDLAYNYSDNSKYVAEYLDRNYKGQFTLVISVREPGKYDHLRQRGMKVVKFNSPQYFFQAMRSRVFLTNSGGFSYLPLGKRTYVINTWHGGGAYKTCGRDMYEDTPIFRKDLLLQGNRTDLFMSTNHRFTEVVSNAMMVPKEVFWEVGMPRNDMLIHKDGAVRDRIRKELGLQEDEKLLLFAPTYRKVNDNYFKDSIAISYGVDAPRVCRAMETRFGGKWRFAVRYHPCIVNRGDTESAGMLDLTDYPDMQELLCAADAMINDFSSSMWDYMLTGRPCFLFATDLQHYVDTTEVYTPVSSWPFPQSTNNDELENTILTFDEEAYATELKRHYDELGGCETGKATELVCQKIAVICLPDQR